MFGFGKRPANPSPDPAEQAAQPAADKPASDAQQQPTQQPDTQAAPQSESKPEGTGFFGRLMAGLSRTRETLTEGLGTLLLGKKAIDQDLLDELETRLLTADVGIKATSAILEDLTARIKRKELADSDALYAALKEILRAMLKPIEVPLQVTNAGGKPYVILMVGVNGVGKTTTIGKLAKRFQQEGRSVVLAAGDTFRAAAVEQLQAWGDRNKVPVVAQHTGADSASVIFDAYQSACAKGVDVLIADTAGRLQNKANLMQELEKVVRVLKKLDPDVPHEVMLVLDATTGQNALSQARSFQEAVKVSGLVLSKLDGTAKGGMVFAIAKELGLPLRFIGIGEKAEDLRPFAAEPFVDALFGAPQA